MPDPLRDLGMFAEDAVSDVRLIAHDFFAAQAASTAIIAVGRFSGSGVGFGNRATQFAVANIVSVVEHYAEQVLLDAGCNPKKVKTWGDKPSAWKTVFGADIEDARVCPSFKAMRGYYETRNAIMHRRGELTHSQRTEVVFARLASAQVERVGHDLVVTANTVRACSEVCVNCVNELDKTINRALL